MKLIGESFDVDFAILPIGDNFTMGITDALKAADFVGTDKIIGMHYDTFEPIIIDRVKVKERQKKWERIDFAKHRRKYFAIKDNGKSNRNSQPKGGVGKPLLP